MRRISIVFLGLLFIIQANAQSVGIGNTTPNKNSILDLQSPTNNQGVLVPRLKTANLTTMAGTFGNTERGMLVFDIDVNAFKYWTGSAWSLLGSDNLGDHKAAQNIEMGSYFLSGDGDNEGVAIDSDGNVSIGTASTNAHKITGELEVTGKVTATDFVYNAPQQRIMAIPAAAWRVGTNSAAVMSDDISEVFLLSGPANSNLLAPVNLPNGARVLSVEGYFENTTAATANFRLYRSYHNDAGFTSATATVPAGSSGYVSLAGLPWTIDNSTYNYFLYFGYSTVVSSAIKLTGVRITYTVGTPD